MSLFWEELWRGNGQQWRTLGAVRKLQTSSLVRARQKLN